MPPDLNEREKVADSVIRLLVKVQYQEKDIENLESAVRNINRELRTQAWGLVIVLLTALFSLGVALVTK